DVPPARVHVSSVGPIGPPGAGRTGRSGRAPRGVRACRRAAPRVSNPWDAALQPSRAPRNAAGRPGSCRRPSDRDRDLGQSALLGDDRAVGGAAGHQRTEGPGALGRVEAELTGGGGRHLRGELAGRVQQTDVARHRLAVAGHLALDGGLTGLDRRGVRAAGLRTAHVSTPEGVWRGRSGGAYLAGPSSIGTPTREPYSVQEPS